MPAIDSVADLKKHYHKGKAKAYAWPGGYQLVYITSDGDTLCPECMTKERGQIIRAVGEKSRDGWRVVAVDINYEDEEMICCNCNKQISASYPTA